MIDNRSRLMLLSLRASLIMALNAIEDVLNIPRSIPKRAEQRSARHAVNP